MITTTPIMKIVVLLVPQIFSNLLKMLIILLLDRPATIKLLTLIIYREKMTTFHQFGLLLYF